MSEPEKLNPTQPAPPLTRGGGVNDHTGRDGEERPGPDNTNSGMPANPAPQTIADRTGR